MNKNTMTDTNQINVAIGTTGLILIFSAVIGFVGEKLGWLSLASFLPWVALGSFGTFLFLAKGTIREVLRSVEILGAKIELQEAATERAIERIDAATQLMIQVESKIALSASVHANMKTENSVGGLNLVNIGQSSNADEIGEAVVRFLRGTTIQQSAQPASGLIGAQDAARGSNSSTLSGYKPTKPSYLQSLKDD